VASCPEHFLSGEGWAKAANNRRVSCCGRRRDSTRLSPLSSVAPLRGLARGGGTMRRLRQLLLLACTALLCGRAHAIVGSEAFPLLAGQLSELGSPVRPLRTPLSLRLSLCSYTRPHVLAARGVRTHGPAASASRRGAGPRARVSVQRV